MDVHKNIMGLHPLEFSECFTDSPHFREKVHSHEKELERTSKAIKALIAEVKELIRAARGIFMLIYTFIVKIGIITN